MKTTTNNNNNTILMEASHLAILVNEQEQKARLAKSDQSKKNFSSRANLYEKFYYTALENNVQFYASLKDNMGSIGEAFIKSLLKNKPLGMSRQGETDLYQGSNNFEIKITIEKGSSEMSSLDSHEYDVLLISDIRIRIIRKENLSKLPANLYKKNTTRLKWNAIECEYAIETAFTKRLEELLGY